MPEDNSDLLHGRISTVIHVAAGACMGYMSHLMADVWSAVVASLVVLIVVGFIVQRLLGRTGRKWWLTNGGLVYILIWIMVWIFFFNI